VLIKEFLENVCNQIRYKPMREDISEELGLHIQEMKEEHMSYGLSEKEAEERVVANMGDSIEIGKKLDKIHRPKFDWILFLLVGILIGFGFLVSSIRIQRISGGSIYYLTRHIKFFIIGLVFSAGIYFLDYRKVVRNYKMIYILSSIIMIFTALFGYNQVGTTKWIYIKYFRVNPTNICLLLYTIAFAGMISNLDKKVCNINIEKFNFKFRVDILKLIIFATISIILIMSISGFTMSMVLLLSYIVIATAYIVNSKENVKKNLFKLYGFLISLGIILIIFCTLTQNGLYYIALNRLDATYNYSNDARERGWVSWKINEVLENANMFSGLDDMDPYFGLFDGGTNNALITLIAYYGISFSIIVIATVVLLAVKLIMDYRRVKDTAGSLLIIGLGSIILFQSILNILMNLNLVPTIDVSLPFVSYGMNGLLINMMSIAFILSIYRRKDILTKNEKAKKLKFKISYE